MEFVYLVWDVNGQILTSITFWAFVIYLVMVWWRYTQMLLFWIYLVLKDIINIPSLSITLPHFRFLSFNEIPIIQLKNEFKPCFRELMVTSSLVEFRAYKWCMCMGLHGDCHGPGFKGWGVTWGIIRIQACNKCCEYGLRYLGNVPSKALSFIPEGMIIPLKRAARKSAKKAWPSSRTVDS